MPLNIDTRKTPSEREMVRKIIMGLEYEAQRSESTVFYTDNPETKAAWSKHAEKLWQAAEQIDELLSSIDKFDVDAHRLLLVSATNRQKECGIALEVVAPTPEAA